MKRSLALLSLAALLLAACNSGGSDTIKIGFIGPLTGDAVSAGQDILHGTELAIAGINAKGGINGKKVQLVVEDGRCNGADSTSAAQKLVTIDKVVAILGGQCSSETLAAAATANSAKIPLLSAYSSNPDVTKAGDYVFRDYPSDALKGKALAAYFQTSGYTKMAVLSENTDYSQGMRSAIKADLPAGITAVFDEVVEPGTKDFRTLMTRMKDSGFDVFLANGQSDATTGEMIKQMRAQGMTQPIVGTDTADSLTLVDIAGTAVEGVKPLSTPALDESKSEGKAFAEAFRAQYQEPKQSMFLAALSYDAAGMLLQAITKAGTADPALHDALAATKDYQGAAGTMSFDANGDILGIPFAMKEFKGGKLIQSALVEVK